MPARPYAVRPRGVTRIALGPYLVLAAVALLLLGLQQVFLSLSALDQPQLLLWPQTEGVPIPDPTPGTP